MRPYTKSPVGAHYGMRDWLLQRLTAVVMLVYTVALVAVLVRHTPGTYAEWRAIFSGPFFRAFTLFFFLALLYHAWVGMRDIVMDYIKSSALRLLLETAIGAALLLYLIWVASILWSR